MESDLHRDADRDEHAEFVESAPRSDRSHGHLRCLQRDRAPLHADLRPERRRQRGAPRSSGSVAPSSGHRCRVHDAGGPVPLTGRHSWATVTRPRSPRSATTAETADNHGSAALPGAQTSRRPSSPGGRPMASTRATRRSPEERRSASGARYAPATAMSAQGLAFTAPFVVESNTQFRPGPPRALASATYAEDFDAVKALGRQTGSTRTDAQTELAPFWEGNASVHWNQAANQIARANQLSMSDSNRLLAVLNIAMADTALTIWSAKRHYGADPAEVTWRPLTAITLAETDGIAETAPDPDWLPLVTTPSHPEYPAGHPALNGAAATVLSESLRRPPDIHADDVRTAQPDVHRHLASARRWQQRPDLGRDALPQHGRGQRRRRRSDRRIHQRELDAVASRSAHNGTTEPKPPPDLPM